MDNTIEFATQLAIVVPTNFELAPYQKIWPSLASISVDPWEIYKIDIGKIAVSIIVSYIGPANAAAATERLMTQEQPPQVILHGGAAGAIKSSLMPGDIVLGKEIKTICSREILAVRQSLLLSASAIRYLQNGKPVHKDSLQGDATLLGKANLIAQRLCAEAQPWDGPGWPVDIIKRPPLVSQGCLGSQDGWTKNQEQLKFIATTFGADTEDMESVYVAQIAAKHNIPFLAVRAISNNEHIATLAKTEIFPAVGLAAKKAAQVICGLVEELGTGN